MLFKLETGGKPSVASAPWNSWLVVRAFLLSWSELSTNTHWSTFTIWGIFTFSDQYLRGFTGYHIASHCSIAHASSWPTCGVDQSFSSSPFGWSYMSCKVMIQFSSKPPSSNINEKHMVKHCFFDYHMGYDRLYISISLGLYGWFICIHLHLFALKSHVAPCKKDGDKFETWNIWEKHHLYHPHPSILETRFVCFFVINHWYVKTPSHSSIP